MFQRVWYFQQTSRSDLQFGTKSPEFSPGNSMASCRSFPTKAIHCLWGIQPNWILSEEFWSPPSGFKACGLIQGWFRVYFGVVRVGLYTVIWGLMFMMFMPIQHLMWWYQSGILFWMCDRWLSDLRAFGSSLLHLPCISEWPSLGFQHGQQATCHPAEFIVGEISCDMIVILWTLWYEIKFTW